VKTEVIWCLIAHQASQNAFSSDIQETLWFYYQGKAFTFIIFVEGVVLDSIKYDLLTKETICFETFGTKEINISVSLILKLQGLTLVSCHEAGSSCYVYSFRSTHLRFKALILIHWYKIAESVKKYFHTSLMPSKMACLAW